MKQHWLDSFMEAICSTVIGFLIAVPLQWAFCQVAHIPMNIGQNMALVGFMTVVSVVRGYFVRRLFNGRTIWQALKRYAED